MKLFLDRIPSPIGTMVLVTDDRVVRALDFEDYEPRMHRLLRVHYGPCELELQRERLGVRAAFDTYFAGGVRALDGIPVETNGTAFQRAVWQELRRIAPGTTMSYGGLALRLGAENGSRAVGSANGSNPIGIIVPCHRVIGSDGSLTGYAGGVSRKAWLLLHEGVAIAEPIPLPL